MYLVLIVLICSMLLLRGLEYCALESITCIYSNSALDGSVINVLHRVIHLQRAIEESTVQVVLNVR